MATTKTAPATKSYKLLVTTPRLGKAGDTVTLTEAAAKYWLLAGVIEAA
ncbi:MAG: hypothetical protein RLZZ501_2258 [Pseudomonadota bacterium]|jgi:hypothetical protein